MPVQEATAARRRGQAGRPRPSVRRGRAVALAGAARAAIGFSQRTASVIGRERLGVRAELAAVVMTVRVPVVAALTGMVVMMPGFTVLVTVSVLVVIQEVRQEARGVSRIVRVHVRPVAAGMPVAHERRRRGRGPEREECRGGAARDAPASPACACRTKHRRCEAVAPGARA
jgi:uncharacterized membrane protein